MIMKPPLERHPYVPEHDDVIKWKHLPRNWPFVRGIHRSPVNSPHKGQWRGALMFSLICVWINDWVNNREAAWWFETPSRPLWRHCNDIYCLSRCSDSYLHINGLVQDCSNSSVLAMELLQSCTKHSRQFSFIMFEPMNGLWYLHLSKYYRQRVLAAGALARRHDKPLERYWHMNQRWQKEIHLHFFTDGGLKPWHQSECRNSVFSIKSSLKLQNFVVTCI